MAARHYTFEDSAAVSELKRWGFWKGLQYAADGYSMEDTLARLMTGSSTTTEHKVLCKDMPAEAWEINYRVMTLPTDYIAVLVGRFCLPVKRETGQLYEPYEIAEALHIGVWTYRHRLTAAKRRYRSLIFGATLDELQSESKVAKMTCVLSTT